MQALVRASQIGLQLQCIIDHAPTVGCGFTDIECQCASEPLYEILAGCVVDNCTIEEAIGKTASISPSDSIHPARH